MLRLDAHLRQFAKGQREHENLTSQMQIWSRAWLLPVPINSVIIFKDTST